MHIKLKLQLFNYSYKKKIITLPFKDSYKKRSIKKSIIFLILISSVFSCIDPVPPEFDYRSDLTIIDAVASTIPGTTYANIKKTVFEYGRYSSRFISGCNVTLINSDTKEEVSFVETQSSYLVSQDFKLTPGSRWEMEVLLPNGKRYRSQAELVPNEVGLDKISERFTRELVFDEAIGKYIAGHEISIDFQEPEEEQNFYYYQYRSFEKEKYCKLCNNGVYRFGECISQIDNPQAKDYYTYLCDQTCWKINYNEEILLFEDEFTNGKSILNLLVGRVPFYSNQDILVEILQLNITQKAYKYFKSIKDIVDNNSGFNAPLPSALIGNFYNVDDSEDPILGRFTAAAGKSKSIFIKRGQINVKIVGEYKSSQPELLGDPLPNPITYEAPCVESRLQTVIKPLKWDQ